MRTVASLIVVVITLWSCPAADAGEATVTVYGTVADSTSTLIPEAEVTFAADGDTVTTLTDNDGCYEAVLIYTTTHVEEHAVPSAFSLKQNYPNPFNPTTTIPFFLNKSARVRLDIFSVTGQRVRTLVDGFIGTGSHAVAWDGLDDNGGGVSAGVYLYRLRAGGRVASRKMLMLDGHAAGASFHGMTAAHTLSKTVEPAVERTYAVTVAKSTMREFHGTLEVSFDKEVVAYDVVLPDTYKTYDVFFDTPGVLNAYVLPGDTLGVTLVQYHEPLPVSGEIVVTSRAGDSEKITVSGSAGYFKKWDYCATLRHYFPDSRNGSVVTDPADPVPGNGILQVGAANDTISAVYVTPRGNIISTSIPLVDSIETVRLWERTYYQWEEHWYWMDENKRWVRAQDHDCFVTFDESVGLETIERFLTDNNLEVGYHTGSRYLIKHDSPMTFLRDHTENPVIEYAELIEQGCITL